MVGVERNLARWQAAGLIDAETAQAIHLYEQQNARPIAQWAIAGLALLALALGMTLLVAANWDQISAPVKLGVHYALTAASALAISIGRRRGAAGVTEGALFLLGALVLGGIALQGQIYQLTSPIWQPLAIWTALCGPALLMLGTTRLTGLTLGLMACWLGIALVADGTDELGNPISLQIGAALAIPFLMVLISALIGKRPKFAAALHALSLATLLVVGSFAHLAWAATIDGADIRESLKVLPIPLVAALLCIAAVRKAGRPQNVTVTTVVATFAAAALVAFIPHDDAWPWRLFGTAIYTVMWGAICRAAVTEGWRLLFGLGVGAIALRLFIVYFELFGTLATTGAGLIVGGLLVLVLLWTWQRIMARTRRQQGGVA